MKNLLLGTASAFVVSVIGLQALPAAAEGFSFRDPPVNNCPVQQVVTGLGGPTAEQNAQIACLNSARDAYLVWQRQRDAAYITYMSSNPPAPSQFAIGGTTPTGVAASAPAVVTAPVTPVASVKKSDSADVRAKEEKSSDVATGVKEDSADKKIASDKKKSSERLSDDDQLKACQMALDGKSVASVDKDKISGKDDVASKKDGEEDLEDIGLEYFSLNDAAIPLGGTGKELDDWLEKNLGIIPGKNGGTYTDKSGGPMSPEQTYFSNQVFRYQDIFYNSPDGMRDSSGMSRAARAAKAAGVVLTTENAHLFVDNTKGNMSSSGASALGQIKYMKGMYHAMNNNFRVIGKEANVPLDRDAFMKKFGLKSASGDSAVYYDKKQFVQASGQALTEDQQKVVDIWIQNQVRNDANPSILIAARELAKKDGVVATNRNMRKYLNIAYKQYNVDSQKKLAADQTKTQAAFTGFKIGPAPVAAFGGETQAQAEARAAAERESAEKRAAYEAAVRKAEVAVSTLDIPLHPVDFRMKFNLAKDPGSFAWRSLDSVGSSGFELTPEQVALTRRYEELTRGYSGSTIDQAAKDAQADGKVLSALNKGNYSGTVHKEYDQYKFKGATLDYDPNKSQVRAQAVAPSAPVAAEPTPFRSGGAAPVAAFGGETEAAARARVAAQEAAAAERAAAERIAAERAAAERVVAEERAAAIANRAARGSVVAPSIDDSDVVRRITTDRSSIRRAGASSSTSGSVSGSNNGGDGTGSVDGSSASTAADDGTTAGISATIGEAATAAAVAADAAANIGIDAAAAAAEAAANSDDGSATDGGAGGGADGGGGGDSGTGPGGAE